MSSVKTKICTLLAVSSLTLGSAAIAGLTVDEQAFINDAVATFNLNANETANLAYAVALANGSTGKTVLYHHDAGESAVSTKVSSTASSNASLYKPVGMLQTPAANKYEARQIVNAVDGAILLTEAMGL